MTDPMSSAEAYEWRGPNWDAGDGIVIKAGDRLIISGDGELPATFGMKLDRRLDGEIVS